MLSLQDWCCSNKRLLNEIDVRRIVDYIFFREEKTIIKGDYYWHTLQKQIWYCKVLLILLEYSLSITTTRQKSTISMAHNRFYGI